MIFVGEMEFEDNTLPEECPPPSAKELDSSLFVFRMVKTDPPTIQDFQSQWTLKPEKRQKWSQLECRFKAVSVFESRTKCEKMLKLTGFKNLMPCRLELTPGSGMIDATGSQEHFHL